MWCRCQRTDEILTQVSSLLADSKKALAKLQEVTEKAAEMEEGRDQAVYYRDEVKKQWMS